MEEKGKNLERGFEIIHGRPQNRQLVKDLTSRIAGLDIHGTLYQGYLLPATADTVLTLDVLLVTKEHGLVAFSFVQKDQEVGAMDSLWKEIAESQEAIYFALKSHLARQKGLRKGREEAVLPAVITIAPIHEEPPDNLIKLATLENVVEVIGELDPIEEKYWKPLNAAIENVTTIKPAKRRTNVRNADSRGAKIKTIEGAISNLDYWQKRAALETPEGPQRIRGLAGSGKTVVLAMKAAALHAQNPDWNIGVTFYSRALHQQFRDLITRFSFEYQRDKPDPEKLRIMHAWGARNREGIYRTIAHELDVIPGDYASASSKYGSTRAFEGLCDELLEVAKIATIEPLFDAVLIDEAQDLPVSFLCLIDLFTRKPHRIIFAYDELQKLSDEGMTDLANIFVDAKGNPKYSFENEEGQPRRDEVLPVCYRNTPWALTLAHALGFGIHRSGGMVQHFNDPSRWTKVGYTVEDGKLESGCKVVLKRDPDSYPEYFTEELNVRDAIVNRKFTNEIEQAENTAAEIRTNLAEDELEHDDILVVLPEPYTARSDFSMIKDALKRRGINSHLVGVDTELDEVFTKDSVAVTHIFRAKGNEAPMVYLLNSHRYITGKRELAGRNKIFTAITRSRAWVRIYGIGTRMDSLLKEIEKVRDQDYRLDFKVPTPEELRQMEMVHKVLTPEEKELQREKERSVAKMVASIKSGKLKRSDISEEDRQLLLEFFKEDME
jgi:superfamily I DNA and RNA helicase